MNKLASVALAGVMTLGTGETLSQSSARYDKALAYPLLNTPNYVNLTGDPSKEKNGNFAILQSKICHNSNYECVNVAPLDKNAKYFLYSIRAKSNLPEYPYTYELRTFLKSSNIIKDAVLYSSPRPENGLMNWEINLLDTVVTSLSGFPMNKDGLKRCYLVAIDDLREPCVVQSFSLNGKKYNITVGFINLENFPGNPRLPSPKPDLRNFVLYIHEK